MPVTPDRVFIYGNFKSEQSVSSSSLIAPPPRSTLLQDVLSGIDALAMPHSPDIAIEILREFSAIELVGKLYAKVRTTGGWAPVSQPGLRDYSWYKNYPANRVTFNTEGSAPWDVLFFRQESDESGPYVAVGVKLRPTP
jgi:hypothetical protein